MNLETAKKKLTKSGFVVKENGASYNKRFAYYYATKQNAQTISFEHVVDADIVASVKVRDNDDKGYPASSLAAAIKTADGKLLKNDATIEEMRSSIMQRLFHDRFVSDDEILKLKLHSRKDVQLAFQDTFPHVFAYKKKNDNRTYRLRTKINNKIHFFWRRLIDIHERTYPDLQPLIKIQIQTNVENNDNIFLNSHQVLPISGYVPIFSKNESSAISMASLIFGNKAKIDSAGIVAIGAKEEALRAYERDMQDNVSSTKSINYEIGRLDMEIKAAEKNLQNLQKSLEYSKKRYELSTLIEGMSNTVKMSSST